jgi:predicted neuraminidase
MLPCRLSKKILRVRPEDETGIVIVKALSFVLAIAISSSLSWAAEPVYQSELIFPMEKSHNHGSSIVELPNGELLVAWYRGSGEHEADDVRIMGARKAYGDKSWSKPFVMTDTANFPDANPVVFVDGEKQLQLIWSMIIANDWRTSFIKNRVSVDFQRGKQAPVWKIGEPLFFDLKDFTAHLHRSIEEYIRDKLIHSNSEQLALLKKSAGNKFLTRMGWIARSSPLTLPTGRILLPLYSDALSLSMMAISDDGGKSWMSSKPIVGIGNIQPTVVRKNDGTLVAYMRNAGPPPRRLYKSVSKDDGVTWSLATHTNLPNPGSAAEVKRLMNGYWVLVYNDTEVGRHSLAVSISDDEGKSWRWTRHLEQDLRAHEVGQFHYPSIVQVRDELIHVSYSYFLNHLPRGTPSKTIKHAAFTLQWVQAGGARAVKNR